MNLKQTVTKMLKYLYQGITFQEVPCEISMVFYLLGCPRHCEDCHSRHFWDISIDDSIGQAFTLYSLRNIIKLNWHDYENCSTLLFMGGDWEEEEFLNVIEGIAIKSAYDEKLNTHKKNLAWYTGSHYNELKYPRLFTKYFDYLKFGPYVKELGGLNNPKTNQVYLYKQWKCANDLFHSNGEEKHEHVCESIIT